VPRALRLVDGVAYPKRTTPPDTFPAARRTRKRRDSGLDGVAALAVFRLGGLDRQAHFLANGAADETANAVRLPPSGFHQLLHSGSVPAFEQIQDFGGEATLVGDDLTTGCQLLQLGGNVTVGPWLAKRLGLRRFRDWPRFHCAG
jgi:hypothetical protein